MDSFIGRYCIPNSRILLLLSPFQGRLILREIHFRVIALLTMGATSHTSHFGITLRGMGSRLHTCRSASRPCWKICIMSGDNISSFCFRRKCSLKVSFSKIANIDNAKPHSWCTGLHGTVTELLYKLEAFRGCMWVDSGSDDQGGINGDQIPTRLLLVDLPGFLFRKDFEYE